MRRNVIDYGAISATSGEDGDERDGPSRLAEVSVCSALGLLLVAVAFAGARSAEAWSPFLFWSGLATIIVPIGYRLLGTAASVRERMALVLLLTLLLYGVKIMHSPDGFTFHDEFGQYRSTEDVKIYGGLFNENPIVRVYADYPGMQSVAAAISSISGLGIFASGVILIGAARAVLAVALFSFLARVIGSARVAGVAMAVYACNPNFLFFDGQFGYESLAIPLAAATLMLAARADDARAGRWAAAGIALVVAAATVITHHLTAYAMVLALIVWATVQLIRARGATASRSWIIPFIAVASATLAAAWWLVAGDETGSQLGTTLGNAFGSVLDIITGSGSARTPFSGNPGFSDPLLERIVGLASVALLLATLPFGLWAIWKRRGHHPALVLLGLIAAAYPITLAIRLGANGAETSSRTSEFVFVGLGVGLGLAFLRWIAPRLREGRSSIFVRASLAAFLGLLFAGGLTVGWPSQARLPGPYQVGGGSRAIDEEGVAAAWWARRWLPDRSVILADAANKGLMAAYGHQNPQGGVVDGREVGTLYFSTSLRPRDINIIRVDKVQYLVVDQRMSTALPRSGRYFDSGEPRKYSQPPSPYALLKFDLDPRLQRVYAGGNIVIYDTSGLLRADGEP